MLERFINKTTFESQEDFIKNFKIKVPENFNFGYDVVDAWAEEEPDKIALCWTCLLYTSIVVFFKIHYSIDKFEPQMPIYPLLVS